jgi:hypothetical protein
MKKVSFVREWAANVVLGRDHGKGSRCANDAKQAQKKARREFGFLDACA